MILARPDLVHLPAGGPYLATHSAGCIPKTALPIAQQHYFEPWVALGGDAWPKWLSGLDDYRELLASLLGGNAADYCPQPNLSAGLSKLLPALPRPTTDKNVWIATEETFPSLGFAMQMSERWGYKIRFIPRERDPAELETWIDAMLPDVCGALVMHVHSNTGVVAPVIEIAKLCAERGLFSLIDVAQSAGILPLDVEAIGADVVLGSCIKWLCGGPGAGFMWIRPTLIDKLEPADVGWFSHSDPFEFDIRSFRYAIDARRFMGGTPAVAPYIIATAGLRLLAEFEVERAFSHNRLLMSYFLDSAPATIRAAARLNRIGGTLCVEVGKQIDTVRAALTTAGVRFDCRGSVVRISFHLYNTIDDAILAARAWPR